MSGEYHSNVQDSEAAEILATVQQSPGRSDKNKSQTSNATSSSLLLDHYGEVDIEPEPIDAGLPSKPQWLINRQVHQPGVESVATALSDDGPPLSRGAPQAFSPIGLQAHRYVSTNNLDIHNNNMINAENMPAPTPLDHLMHSLQNDIAMTTESSPDDLDVSGADDNIDMSMYAAPTLQTLDAPPVPVHAPEPKYGFTPLTLLSSNPDKSPTLLPITIFPDKKPLIKAPSEMKNISTQMPSSSIQGQDQGYLTIPQAIQLVRLQEIKVKGQKNKSHKRKLPYRMYSSAKYHPLHHIQQEVQQEQEGRYALPTAAQIAGAIPSDASSIFHIFDRRIDFDALPGDASNYSLLRRWVQDDPYRKDLSRLPNLMDYVVLPSQQRKKIDDDDSEGPGKSVSENEGDDDSDAKKQPCDVLGSSAINNSSVIDMRKCLESYIAKGAVKRKKKNTALKARDRAVLKRLEKTLGVKVKDS